MLAFYAQFELEEGYEFLSSRDKYELYLHGSRVSRAAGWSLFQAMRGTAIVCWKCGLEACTWVACRGQKDMSNPTVNLFGYNSRGALTMMTRDHIIPKSLGGFNVVENLRPGCEKCNSGRGNRLNNEDLEFMFKNRGLFNPNVLRRNFKKTERRFGINSGHVLPFLQFFELESARNL